MSFTTRLLRERACEIGLPRPSGSGDQHVLMLDDPAARRELTDLCLVELALARADGTYARVLAKIARADVLVIDDFAMTPITDAERRDLFEVLDDRHGNRATIISSQIPPKRFHEYIGEPTHADAICDRLIHTAHKLVLKGPSRRDQREESEK